MKQLPLLLSAIATVGNCGCGDSSTVERAPRASSSKEIAEPQESTPSPPSDVNMEAIQITSIGGDSSEVTYRASARQKIEINARFQSETKLPRYVVAKVMKIRDGKRPMNFGSAAVEMNPVGDGTYELTGTIDGIKEPGMYLLQISRRGEIFGETPLEIIELN